MIPIDLRSDTVTRPTPEMRQLMAEAAVGDDVFGDDPTVRALEVETARLLGKDEAVFVPSGTMANQIGLALVARSGTEILVEANSHIVNYEGGAPAALWGITLRPIEGVRGTLDPMQILANVRGDDLHFATTVAVSLENSHNREGGAVWPRVALDAAYAAAREAGLAVHLDGARLWNAALATGVDVAALAWGADTVSVCFSKGLGAPVGSAIALSADRAREARRLRKRLGGGMRQAGILAAGALYALEHHRDRLADDHARAARMGRALKRIKGVQVLPVETNLVIFDLKKLGRRQDDVVRHLAREGLLAVGIGDTRIRIVSHLDIDDAQTDRAIEILRRVLGGTA